VSTPVAQGAPRRRLWPGPDQVALRALVVGGVVTALGAAGLAGAHPAGWVLAGIVGLATINALRPDSVAGVVALGGSAFVWALAPEPLSPLVLVVAGGMVLAHVSALVAAQGPALIGVDGRQVWLWLRRGVVLWLAALAVWGLALLVDDHPGGRTTYAVGLLLLAAVAVVGTRVVSRRVG
jgi:hypothetical protein